MTEAEWLDAGFRRRMDFLRGRAGERKLLLFAVGCCRSVWHLLPIHRQRLVVAMDRSADDVAARNLVFAVDDPAIEIQEQPGTQQAASAMHPLQMFWDIQGPRDVAMRRWNAADLVARSVAEALAKTISWWDVRDRHARLLQCVFGPQPFRTITFDPRWRTSDVVGLARAVYEDRVFDRLPILADALMDAGCDDEDILDHCRSDGPHARGCWVVDLVLGKE